MHHVGSLVSFPLVVVVVVFSLALLGHLLHLHVLCMVIRFLPTCLAIASLVTSLPYEATRKGGFC